jgi:hypothetical protein
MLSSNAYLAFVGGAVRSRHGSFTVSIPGREEVFPGGKCGSLYLYFEEKMQETFACVTPLGPIAGNVATMREVFQAAKEEYPDHSPPEAVSALFISLTQDVGDGEEVVSFAAFFGGDRGELAVRCEDAGALGYMEAAYPEGLTHDGVFYRDPTRAVKPRIKSLVEEIALLAPAWPNQDQAPVAAGGTNLEQIAAGALLGDRNQDPNLLRKAQEVVRILGSRANQQKAAKCLPAGHHNVEEFLTLFQASLEEKVSISFSLEQLAHLLNRYQGVLRYDPQRRLIKHGEALP